MATATSQQLLLLADHLKLSLLERQRAISLNLEPNKHDPQITRSLTNLQQGLEELEAQEGDLDVAEENDGELPRLRKQYEELYAQFHGTAPPSVATTRPNNPTLQEDFNAAQRRRPSNSRNKSVRFRDNPNEEDPVDQANRNALFAEQDRYRDEPSDYPDQSGLDNQQIHTYHKQVIQEQDEQLETLGQSVRRQRMMGIEMGTELDEQNEMLDHVEGGVDRHMSTLERARRRLGNVARKSKDNWSWVTIGILICVLVLLIIVLK